MTKPDDPSPPKRPHKVQVPKPANRLIYINGNYTEPAGNTSINTFIVRPGGNVFETLNADGKVDYRKKFRVGPRDTTITIELDPVDPPEKI